MFGSILISFWIDLSPKTSQHRVLDASCTVLEASGDIDFQHVFVNAREGGCGGPGGGSDPSGKVLEGGPMQEPVGTDPLPSKALAQVQ